MVNSPALFSNAHFYKDRLYQPTFIYYFYVLLKHTYLKKSGIQTTLLAMKALEIISVPVTDPQKSKAFYLKMGLELVIEAPFSETQTWIQLRFPEGSTSITLVNWFPQMPAGTLTGITISTDDINADITFLNKNGIETGKIDTNQWGTFCSITDPDGNVWILHQK